MKTTITNVQDPITSQCTTHNTDSIQDWSSMLCAIERKTVQC
jgi:hypothetical protein